MKKTVLTGLCVGSLLLAGCSTPATKEATEPSLLESIPFVYRPDIQQGNVITQEKVNLLKPGMSQQQVRFILGTPLLIDPFHQDRWDYHYSLSQNRNFKQKKTLSVFFKEGRLTRVEGDLQPDPSAPAQTIDKETVVKVPDYVPAKKGLVERMLKGAGVPVLDKE
ncbi:MAG TPA: outer membrane protein assembly factor BamE [Chromatiales bacterium]|nr:outer membrane protein assembly factor BamE [Chromatiales bacterium]